MRLPSKREFQLLALTITERSGREVAQLYERETGTKLSYGTLYATFKKLMESGWVRQTDSENEDGRVRYFIITGPGVKALNAARVEYRSLAKFGTRLAT